MKSTEIYNLSVFRKSADCLDKLILVQRIMFQDLGLHPAFADIDRVGGDVKKIRYGRDIKADEKEAEDHIVLVLQGRHLCAEIGHYVIEVFVEHGLELFAIGVVFGKFIHQRDDFPVDRLFGIDQIVRLGILLAQGTDCLKP